ncbi:hypothetical protein ACWIUD_10150 [Helicobacter sp. 23-1044]
MPPADFLLEAEKRGTPPKSEKRQLLASRGSGEGGAALLREKSSESNPKNGENLADSANETKIAESILNCHMVASLRLQILRIERSEISQNIDSSLRTSCYAQNDKMDCHDLTSSNLAKNQKIRKSRDDKNLLDSAFFTKFAESPTFRRICVDSALKFKKKKKKKRYLLAFFNKISNQNSQTKKA